MRSDLLDPDEFPSHYEDRADDISWAKGTLPVSGVFLLHGSYVVAPYHGPAERRLREAGALCVAMVTFDGLAVAALTGGSAGRGDVDVVRAREVARHADPPPGRN
ncbi:hypothetical protein [Longimicrobium sp.]|uniref:hypothetical protein n=1 Tax=Longimicrobium sp. TaxID=2029185 RepID=UPI002ED92392